MSWDPPWRSSLWPSSSYPGVSKIAAEVACQSWSHKIIGLSLFVLLWLAFCIFILCFIPKEVWPIRKLSGGTCDLGIILDQCGYFNVSVSSAETSFESFKETGSHGKETPSKSEVTMVSRPGSCPVFCVASAGRNASQDPLSAPSQCRYQYYPAVTWAQT